MAVNLARSIRKYFPENAEHPEEQPRRIYAYALILVGAPFIVPFSIQDLVQRNFFELVVELAVLGALGVLLHLIRKSTRPARLYRTAIALFATLLFTIVLDLGGSPEKLYWLFIFPPISFFVLGRKEGFFWNIAFMAIASLFILLDLWRLIAPATNAVLEGKARFIVSYFVVASSSYTYSVVQEIFSGRILRERTLLRKQKQRILNINEKIREMSITDTLTGVYNRGYMHSRLMNEVARADRYGRPLSIVMLDIDHFKQINDSYGHPAGDQALKEVVARINATIRKGVDWIARYGGEEFLIVLPEIERSGAAMLAERIRNRLADAPFPVSGQEVQITGSFGVAFWKDEAGKPRAVESFISLADDRLYRAKRGGRNRVVAT